MTPGRAIGSVFFSGGRPARRLRSRRPRTGAAGATATPTRRWPGSRWAETCTGWPGVGRGKGAEAGYRPNMPRRARTTRPRGAAATAPPSIVDRALPARPIVVELLGGRAHYERVIAAVAAAETSVWIATATLKELMVEDGRARPGQRRRLGAASYRSVLEVLADLARRGVELRVLHAELPSRPFRAELLRQPVLTEGGLALRRCPRVHLKLVVVDGAFGYLGSANWTGAGLGARGRGRRNFELGLVSDDALLLDHTQAVFERIWSGQECAGCGLRADCPGPLDQVAAAAARPAPGAAPTPAPAPAGARPRRGRPSRAGRRPRPRSTAG
jgi:phosphatidylserine/phosphatidylglycerophosphate/cardiolipin synthase-like enzyme